MRPSVCVSFNMTPPRHQIKRSSIRKGMVMVSPRLSPQATWEFEAEILVLHHPTTISPRYQAMGGYLRMDETGSSRCLTRVVSLSLPHHSVHCGSIRQTATILSMNRDCLRTGDKASVHFRFIKTPEYLHCDQRLVFREGRTKAVGTITKVGNPRGSLLQRVKNKCHGNSTQIICYFFFFCCI